MGRGRIDRFSCLASELFPLKKPWASVHQNEPYYWAVHHFLYRCGEEIEINKRRDIKGVARKASTSVEQTKTCIESRASPFRHTACFYVVATLSLSGPLSGRVLWVTDRSLFLIILEPP